MPSKTGEKAKLDEKTKPGDQWDYIDQQFKRTIIHAENAYRTNYWVNLIIVGLGIVFLGSSLYFSFARGIDPSTLTYAGLGIADFVALFLVNPQRRIQQLIADLNQVMVIYRTWLDQLTFTENPTWDATSGSTRTLSLDEAKNVNTELARIAEEALSALEKFIGAQIK